MKKLTLSALVAIGFFASDVAGNQIYHSAHLVSRQGGDWCQGFQDHVCISEEARVPPPGRPDLCNKESCDQFLSEHPDFPECIKACPKGDQGCANGCFGPPPERRRRRQDEGASEDDFCVNLNNECLAQGPPPAPAPERRRQEEHPEGKPLSPKDLCDLDTCDIFIYDNPCFVGCAKACPPEDHKCLDNCLKPGCGDQAPPPARRRQGKPQPPPKGDFCEEVHKMCEGGPKPTVARFAIRQEGEVVEDEVEGEGEGESLCDRKTCEDFIVQLPCFPRCVRNCPEGDHDCVGQCFSCDEQPQPERRAIRRRHALRKSHN